MAPELIGLEAMQILGAIFSEDSGKRIFAELTGRRDLNRNHNQSEADTVRGAGNESRIKEGRRWAVKSKERILAALRNEQPDKVPIFELWISDSIIVNLVRLLMSREPTHKVTKDMAGEANLETLNGYCFVVKELGLDATCYRISMGLKRIGADYVRDKYGTVYLLSEHGEPMPVEGPIRHPSDIRGFDMASKLDTDDFASIQHVINEVGKSKAHFVVITDPFKISWCLRGRMQNLLLDYLMNPQLAHDLASISTDFCIAAIDISFEIGADVVVIAGDLAGNQTTIMSPKHYRQYLKPPHKRIVEHAHKKNLRIVKHSDGNLWPIVDDLLEVGFDGIHPIQPQCMNIADVKRHLGRRMCILGNIDCQRLLPFGTGDEVEEVVKETITRAAPQGGFIISSSSSIHPGCKPENYISMVEAAHKHGSYV